MMQNNHATISFCFLHQSPDVFFQPCPNTGVRQNRAEQWEVVGYGKSWGHRPQGRLEGDPSISFWFVFFMYDLLLTFFAHFIF